MKKISDRRSLTLLLLFALAVRVIWALLQPSTDAAIDRLPDQREYLSLGQNLLHEGTLSFVDQRFDQRVYAYRTPGYPFFVALLDGSPPVIRLVQCIVDTSTVLAIYLIGWQLAENRRVALWAAAIVAVNPFLIYFCGLILSETLFTALLAWGMLLLVRRKILSGSVLFALAVLVRPSALFLSPCVALMIPLLNPSPKATYPLWRVLRNVATALIVIFIGLLPWAIRNHRTLNTWIWTTTNSGITLYDGFNPDATGNSDQRFLSQMPELRSMNEVERSAFLRHSAGVWIASHPDELANLTLKKISRTWSPIPLSEQYGRPTYRLFSAMYAVPFDMLVLIGLFSRSLRTGFRIRNIFQTPVLRYAEEPGFNPTDPGLRRTRSTGSGQASDTGVRVPKPLLGPKVKLMLAIPAIYFTIVHAMSVGSLRYRVPIEPELALIAAAGAVAISGGTKQPALVQ